MDPTQVEDPKKVCQALRDGGCGHKEETGSSGHRRQGRGFADARSAARRGPGGCDTDMSVAGFRRMACRCEVLPVQGLPPTGSVNSASVFLLVKTRRICLIEFQRIP